MDVVRTQEGEILPFRSIRAASLRFVMIQGGDLGF